MERSPLTPLKNATRNRIASQLNAIAHEEKPGFFPEFLLHYQRFYPIPGFLGWQEKGDRLFLGKRRS